MNTKTIAAIIVFTALTVALNLSPLKYPAPYLPYLIYQIWEIPIVTAFLLYGATVGVSTAFINTLVLIVVFPGALPTGPLYNLAAVLSTLLGIRIVKIFIENRPPKHEAFSATLLTMSGVILRTGVMAFVNWVALRLPFPFGYSMTEEAIIPIIPLVAVFNFTLALYTVPLGYSLARVVESSVKTPK